MIEHIPFEAPQITDEEIRWASRLLGLPDEAFFGEDGTDRRQEVLKDMNQLDIAACPGSGKTTLMVAKLAILANKWQYLTRGICVLSHTNAARSVIETRLGNTAFGRRLLSYPHFIGTIHSFVNEFLTLPFLRALGYSGTQFNDDISGDKLWKLSGYGSRPKYLYTKIKNKGNRKSALRSAHYFDENLDIRLVTPGKPIRLIRRNTSDSFSTIDEWKTKILEDGYATYEDTFAYGFSALKRYPYIVRIIRNRFPLLFIDEAQDNSENQSAILHRIFMYGDAPVVRQRFGDGNQAIYDSVRASGAETDIFPDPSRKKDIPNSYRFGEKIATLADPLGLDPYGLEGLGPQPLLSDKKDTSERSHTIFLFKENNINKVLGAYGELLIEAFSPAQLIEGKFTAVGQVHRFPENTDNMKFPHCVGHYWSDYDPELTRQDPQPHTFVKYILYGYSKANATGEINKALEKVAEAFMRLARMVEGGHSFLHRRYKHRYVMLLLDEFPGTRKKYENMITKIFVEGKLPNQETWESNIRDIAREIAERITGKNLDNSDADAFLAWEDTSDFTIQETLTKVIRDNIYRFSKNGKSVAIRVGSIHSVKGETHTSTLVLETFWHAHNLKSIKDWLCGKECGRAGKVRIDNRLKLHYVAMTRPTHLLCLALKQSIFEGENCQFDQSQLQQLKQHGWQVKLIS